VPFASLDDAPWWVRAGLAEPWQDVVVPEVPAGLLEAPESGELPVECGCCVEPEPALFNVHHAPDALCDRFAGEWRLVQQHTARLWRAAAAMCAAVGPDRAEFVGDDIALMTQLHPRTGANLARTGEGACAVPELVALVETGELSSRHAEALLDEAGKWTDNQDKQQEVLELTLARCRVRSEKNGCWPTPGELRKRLRTAALLLDLTAAEKHTRSVFERRGVGLHQSGIGQGTLCIEGPEVSVVQIMDCLRARAEALGRLPGDARSREQRLFDAASELLTVDADGGQSPVPTLDDSAQPVTIRVRGVEVSVLVPYSVAVGEDLELAEIPGLGPILPSTARELLAQAAHLRRVAVDADTGAVLAVDDRVPGPAPDDSEDVDAQGSAADRPCTAPALHPALIVLLQRLAADPVVHRDLRSTSYRVNGRIRRFIELRDRTCTFPGCTVPGHWCDVDHREPWPLGPTDRLNCHCLCRRHHRAKQAYFTVTLDQRTGDTLWTTPDGRTYRRPPPTF
jgi:hypothetical protein